VAAAAVVHEQIASARRSNASEIVVTGGEPTLRADLPALVRDAGREGARVILETNAARIDAPLAERLASAGLHIARVHLPAWGPALDAITRDPGGASATVAGITALRDVGITVEATAPVLHDNLQTLPSLPAQLAAAEIEVQRLWLRLPRRAPDPHALAPLRAMLTTAAKLIDEARAHALPISLEPATFVPPCLFPRPARVASIYALNRGGADRPGYAQRPTCQECSVRDRCPGIPLDLPDAEPHPLRDDRLRRRLTVIVSPAEQIERELVTRELYRRPDGTTMPAHIVRIGFRCNQACHFCFVSTHLPSPPLARVHAAIDEIGELGGILVLSGGEPTLDPRLPDYVRRGKAAGACEVELQTNATQLGDLERCQTLAKAGVDIAFVSLHGATAATSDRVTATPGTFERTLAGIDALCHAQIRVRLNFVLCELNRHEFPAFVTMVAKRWPSAAITVSFIGMSTDLVPRERWLVPRYRDVLPALREALAIARAHELEIGGFESMCGLPLCLVPEQVQRFASLAELPPGYDDDEGESEFDKPSPCSGCVLKSRCFGLRRGYAELYGCDELKPVTTLPSPEPRPRDHDPS